MGEYVLPIEDFFLQARERIIDEVRETLREGVSSHRTESKFEAESCELLGNHDHHREAVVMWGRTQAGKSTMTCQLRTSSEAPCAEMGDGSGDSVTWTSELWYTLIGFLLDTPGIDDTRLRFTKEEAGRRVAVAVAEANVTRVKFLVFDSMGNDGMQLRDTLASLQVSFGARALEGAVVVGSKANLKPGAAGVKRTQLLRQVMEEQGLKELVLWQGPELNELDLADLKASLSKVPSVPIVDLEDLWNRQQQLAQKLYDSQEKKIKEIFVEVAEQYVVEREEQEPYESSYAELEPVTEKYDAVDCYPVTRTTTVMARKCHTEH